MKWFGSEDAALKDDSVLNCGMEEKSQKKWWVVQDLNLWPDD